VVDNLPLVYSLVARWGPRCELPRQDLAQVGTMGLIRAVEAFDPSRSNSLSSFAVPYIQGAIQHEIRDRQHLLRIPRQLWELRQKVSRLQDDRLRRGLPPLADHSLADALGCDREQIRQARELRQATALHSLDTPLVRSCEEGVEGSRLLDQLPDPCSCPTGPEDGEDAGRDPSDPESLWLRQRLNTLDPVRRQLLEGRLQVGCTWVELGQRLGMPPRQAQRRCLASLDLLRREAEAWREAQTTASLPCQP
jgi:RNA polymerase sigma-B factor